MKKLMFVIGACLVATSLYAACIGPYCYDDRGAAIGSQVSFGVIGSSLTTPCNLGAVAVDSNFILYIATTTGQSSGHGCWMKVSAQ